MELIPNTELKPVGQGANLLGCPSLQQAAAPVLGERLVRPATVEVMPSAEAMHQDRLLESNDVTQELTTLFRQSSHYLAGLVGKLGLGFISLPIFARAFSLADYGLIDLAQKILLLVTAFSKMGMQNSALRFFDAKAFAADPGAARRYYSTMFYGAVLTSAVVAGFFLAASGSVLKYVVDPSLAALMGFVAVLVVLRSMESMLWAFLRIEERTKAYNISTVVVRAATIASVCLALWWFGRSARIFFIGSTGSELAFVVVLSWVLFHRKTLNPARFDPALFRAALLFGCPLIVYEVSGIILDAGDRVMVRHYLGADALGLYSIAYGLAAQLNDLLIFPLGLAIFPIYMRLWKSEGREVTAAFLSTCLDLFLAVATGLCALAVVGSRDALFLLASTKYRGAEHLIPIIVIGLLLYTTHIFLCAGLLIHKRTGTMAALLLVSAAFNLGLNCVLLPRLGLAGAAIATLVAYAVCVMLLGCISVRILPLQLRLLAFAKYVLSAVVVSAVVSRIEFGPPIVNLASRSTATVILYGFLLYAMDSHFRSRVKWILRRSALPQISM